MNNNYINKYTENYSNMKDEDLIRKIKSGDNDALDYILNKYQEVVNMKVSRYFIIGAEKEDIIQEGLIGLYKAIKSFDPEKQNSFKSFANLCIERQLITAIKSSNRQKHMPLNSYLSLNMSAYDNEDDDTSIYDIFDANIIEDPLDTITKKEYYKSVEDIIDKSLSIFEKNVLNELGSLGGNKPVNERIGADQLPSQTDEMKELMDEKVFDEPIRERGIAIKSFVIVSVTPDDASAKKINDYEIAANASMRKGKLTSDYGEAVKSAASNSAGSMNGFMGIGMMNMATGGAMGNVAQGVWQDTTNQVPQQSVQQSSTAQPVQSQNTVVEDAKTNSSEWECPNCGNRDQEKMNVARRTCGYIGTQFWNQGRTQEIKERVLHL